ncbi:unnamed protein product, partial [Prorocentrum cordatum]
QAPALGPAPSGGAGPDCGDPPSRGAVAAARAPGPAAADGTSGSRRAADSHPEARPGLRGADELHGHAALGARELADVRSCVGGPA